jgi:NAD(P)-dependent dehydrogenase (short-subunit alcohol dehydrogenase family)
MANHNLYALVTGGNRGIGLEVCKQLVERKKPVILTCRNVEAGETCGTCHVWLET